MKDPASTSAEFTPSQLAIWSALLLAVASILAWFPIVQPVIAIEAGHIMANFYEDGFFVGLRKTFDWQGVWRIFGFSLVGLSMNLHPLAMPIVTLLSHVATVWLFTLTCARLLGKFRVGLALGVVLATLPLGYQALAWGVIYTVVLSSLVFWVQVWVTVRYGDRVDRQASLFVVIALLTLIGALSYEGLLGAALATCSWFWLRQRPLSLSAILRNMKTFYAGWAPFVGTAVYVAGYYAFRPEYVVKQPGAFNPRSLLSVYYHTTSALSVFGVWRSPVMRSLGFDSWGVGATVLAIVLVVLLSALAIYGLHRIPVRESEPSIPFRVGSMTGFMLLGNSLIYAIGGGFSPESRKLYPICYLMALAAGLLLVQFSLDRFVRPTIVVLVIACCVPTAWLLTGVWRFEAARNHSLARTIAENDIHSPIEIQSDTNPYKAWPYLFNSYGFRLHDIWLVDYTLAFMFPTHGGDLKHAAGEDPTVLRYERNKGWSVDVKGATPPK